MHVISKKMLRQFWTKYPECEPVLRRWYKTARKAHWSNFADVRTNFPTADQVGRFTVFDMGRQYRLITVIHYNRGKIFLRNVLTHAQYDLGHWKER